MGARGWFVTCNLLVYPSFYQPIHHSIRLSITLSAYPSLYQPIHHSISLSITLSAYPSLYQPIHHSISLSITLSDYLLSLSISHLLSLCWHSQSIAAQVSVIQSKEGVRVTHSKAIVVERDGWSLCWSLFDGWSVFGWERQLCVCDCLFNGRRHCFENSGQRQKVV